MSTKIYLSLPVKDVKRATDFYRQLGWTTNDQFTGEGGGSLNVSDDICVMLAPHAKFNELTSKTISDPFTTAQVLITLSLDSKEAVNKLVEAAVKAGGSEPHPLEDYGFMIQRAFQDLDGHGWGVMYVDPNHKPQG
ncbi:MAG: VOC family protein [Alphaproteobacteria bacterium]